MGRQRKRKPSDGPPPARWSIMDGEFAGLIVATDIPVLVDTAGLSLVCDPGDAASLLSRPLESAIGSVLAAAKATDRGWGDVRSWLASVEKDAAALLERLGFAPDADWVERQGRVIVSEGGRHRKDYYQHLWGEAPTGPPHTMDSPAFRHWLRPHDDLEPHLAVLRALPECLSVLMLAARHRQVTLAADGAGRLYDREQRGLCEALVAGHHSLFGRKPVLRDDVGDRGGTGAAWGKAVCRVAAERAANSPWAEAALVRDRLVAVVKLSDAALQDQLSGGRQTRSKQPGVTVFVVGGSAAVDGDAEDEWGDSLRRRDVD